MTSTFRLGSVAGILVGFHYSHFVLLALVTWRISTGFLADGYPDWSPWVYWATGALAVGLLSVSILAHELAHSLVAGRTQVRDSRMRHCHVHFGRR